MQRKCIPFAGYILMEIQINLIDYLVPLSDNDFAHFQYQVAPTQKKYFDKILLHSLALSNPILLST